MIKIIDTYGQINDIFEEGSFSFQKWEEYINSVYENSSHLFFNEVNEYISSGKYTFEKDFLPIISSVYLNPSLNKLHDSFLQVTDGLNKRIISNFGREIDADIVLYLGLCNAAGWVTKINGRDTVLLGVEKIIELNWFDLKSMYGLIYHELGHIYHAQHGVLYRKSEDNRKNFIWQLFMEGIAMHFEQVCVGNPEFYHQDTNGWKEWCSHNFRQILKDFNKDISNVTRLEQRYFGDWCDYHGFCDVGYYLGTMFVKYLLKNYDFDEMINFDIDFVDNLYCNYLREAAR